MILQVGILTPTGLAWVFGGADLVCGRGSENRQLRIMVKPRLTWLPGAELPFILTNFFHPQGYLFQRVGENVCVWMFLEAALSHLLRVSFTVLTKGQQG